MQQRKRVSHSLPVFDPIRGSITYMFNYISFILFLKKITICRCLTRHDAAAPPSPRPLDRGPPAPPGRQQMALLGLDALVAVLLLRLPEHDGRRGGRRGRRGAHGRARARQPGGGRGRKLASEYVHHHIGRT